jgi:hypothetical protein
MSIKLQQGDFRGVIYTYYPVLGLNDIRPRVYYCSLFVIYAIHICVELTSQTGMETKKLVCPYGASLVFQFCIVV